MFLYDQRAISWSNQPLKGSVIGRFPVKLIKYYSLYTYIEKWNVQISILQKYFILIINLLLSNKHMDNQKQKVLAPKARKEKKKNTQTGLLMGQNMNIFSQLSATYLQTKSSATEQQTSFANSTQIIQYHDPNINRLIALLRKKADVTKAKAAVELKQQIIRMNEDNIQQFIQTFTHLFMEIVINEQSKQVIDQFIAMINYILTNFKKILIKQIATVYGPFLVINRANNLNQNKIYSLLFNGTEQQIQEKAIILLLNKNVMKKILVFCRVIIECQESHKIGQQNFQRNCSSLLKVIKQFIRNYQGIKEKKQQMVLNFSKFIEEINQIVSNKLVQEYFKVGGKAKSSFLQFYQVLISAAYKHPQWNIDQQNYSKIICQNFLDKDIVVQQSLWRYCNRQFIQSSLELQKLQKNKQEIKQKQKYWILNKFLPKPDQKLLSVIKIGGQALYKQLPAYCVVFPYTSFEQNQTHKSIINKISFIRKLMLAILDLQDQNQARIQCYCQLASYFIKQLRNFSNLIKELDEKKQQQIRSLISKGQRQLLNSLQDRYYKNPPSSRNSPTFYIPSLFCRLLEQTQPNFDFLFDKKQTFNLFSPLKNGKNSEYCQNLFNRIFQNCKNDQNLLLNYLENFPRRSIDVDMSDKNEKLEQACKIFLLSTQCTNQQNWFRQDWDIRKKLITFDPRISSTDLTSTFQHDSFNKYGFKPSNKLVNEQNYINKQHDEIRLKFFIECLQSGEQEKTSLIIYMVPFVKQIIMERDNQIRNKCINKLLDIHRVSVDKLNNKQWIVSQTEVLRLRVIFELVLEGLRKSLVQKRDKQPWISINKQNVDKFLNSYCAFVLTIYNYKLQRQSEELLKLLSKALYVDQIAQTIFKSVRQSIKKAYETFSKTQNKEIKQLKQGQQKQRKNRLNRFLNYVKKLLWYAINKKKQQNYLTLIEDVLTNPQWKFSQYRPDLWFLTQAILQLVDQRTRQSIAKKITSQCNKFSHIITLLLCCQMVLALQRYPSTKKTIVELQSTILKQMRQSNSEELNLQLMTCSIKEAISNQSFLLIYGAKNMLKNLMKNYQKLSEQNLKYYVSQCLYKPLQSIKQQKQQTSFNRKCLLLISLCSELPLLDLPEIQKIYIQLYNLSLLQSNSLKFLGYLSVIGTLWESAIGIDKIVPQQQDKIIKKLFESLKERIKLQKNEYNNNFVRFFGLTFLNSFIQVRGKEKLGENWDFVLKQLIQAPVKQGTVLHGGLQSARYKLISKIFASSPKDLQKQYITAIPEQILKEIRFYKEVLDQIEDEDNVVDQQSQQTSNHYENIINMFIECAQVIVRMTGSLNKQLSPKQQIILELLQCPFAGIKKTSFMLLKQMYELHLVERSPPVIFLTYLKLNLDISKSQLDPNLANIISGYLYSWQAIIQRRSAIERPPSSQQQTAISLQDYLQSQQLHEPLLKNIFEICQSQLEYTKNEQEYEISPQELLQMDSIVTIQDDFNLHNKMFRLTIRTLFMFIQNFPFFLRQFIDKNKKYKAICERLLRNVITDAIFRQEINKIQVREHEWKANGNFQIYVVPKNKQIYAQYTHDVIRIGLRLFMKSNYPLTPISIEFGQGLKIQQGSRWALMLQTQLHNRNNTIINGILLWKDNIDKKLAGVQQCSICFDIVNSAGHLPKKGCKTCKKKFHSVCIMKWFNKSNKSQCPLCKSQFL